MLEPSVGMRGSSHVLGGRKGGARARGGSTGGGRRGAWSRPVRFCRIRGERDLREGHRDGYSFIFLSVR